MSRLKEVWYGERSLAETWWFWNVFVGNIILAKGVMFIAVILAQAIGNVFPVYLVHVMLFLPFCVWITVGILRSAKKRGGFWGWVAIILSVISLIHVVGVNVALFWEPIERL